MVVMRFKCSYCGGSGSVMVGFNSEPCPVCDGLIDIEVDVKQGNLLVDCNYCGGSGSVMVGFNSEPCPVCKGYGKNVVISSGNSKLTHCGYCSGSGSVLVGFNSEPCPICKGTGYSTPKRISNAREVVSSVQSSSNKPSCFISYGEPDVFFAKKLYNALKNKDIQTWMYAMDNTPGQRSWKEIIDNRRNAKRVLVICSAQSLLRDGILKEIEQQIDEEPDKIIPISLDSQWTNSNFRILRGNSNLKPFLTERNYISFSNDTFEKDFQKLMSVLS
jgi:hypothetical protein